MSIAKHSGNLLQIRCHTLRGSSASLTDHLSFILNFRRSTWSHFRCFTCILPDFQCQKYTELQLFLHHLTQPHANSSDVNWAPLTAEGPPSLERIGNPIRGQKLYLTDLFYSYNSTSVQQEALDSIQASPFLKAQI